LNTGLISDQSNIAFHEPYLRLIKKLLPIMPDASLDSFFFWNSGSEAVETALKMARIVTGRQNIICMQGTSGFHLIVLFSKMSPGAFHGHTFGAMAVTKSKTIYSKGVAPLMVTRHLARLPGN
jgi:4-aminobutyrate aminotransferase